MIYSSDIYKQILKIIFIVNYYIYYTKYFDIKYIE